MDKPGYDPEKVRANNKKRGKYYRQSKPRD